ncbi:MAG: CRISPR-associated endonuclease Cas2 [Desulfovibrio sp.]|jgi:CRISPR-associated protein Cas2|nr:CRISPR-associated endonuclease Cas2 [Desulfovibrio sp.]
MPAEGVRFMRLMVFFDLPVKTREERRAATKFRQFLVNDGYIMVQLSVYSRICRGQDAVQKHLMRLQGNLPSDGCVRSLAITEQQYGRMHIHVGTMKKSEQRGAVQLLLF